MEGHDGYDWSVEGLGRIGQWNAMMGRIGQW